MPVRRLNDSMQSGDLTHLARDNMSIRKLRLITLGAMYFTVFTIIGNNVALAETELQKGDINDIKGGIKGVVDYCGSGPKDRIRIYIPGRQFSLTTGRDGAFWFESIPAGTYDLGFEIKNEFIAEKKAIVVNPGKITDLGRVSICSEIDGKTDEASIPELQVSKDKIGVCLDDFQGTIIVANGRAQCDHGTISQLVCYKDFSDCDKEVANGCEANLMRDDDNCGVCGEICNLEMCVLGAC